MGNPTKQTIWMTWGDPSGDKPTWRTMGHHFWLVVFYHLEKWWSSSMGFGWHPIYEMENNPAMFQSPQTSNGLWLSMVTIVVITNIYQLMMINGYLWLLMLINDISHYPFVPDHVWNHQISCEFRCSSAVGALLLRRQPSIPLHERQRRLRRVRLLRRSMMSHLKGYQLRHPFWKTCGVLNGLNTEEHAICIIYMYIYSIYVCIYIYIDMCIHTYYVYILCIYIYIL